MLLALQIHHGLASFNARKFYSWVRCVPILIDMLPFSKPCGVGDTMGAHTQVSSTAPAVYVPQMGDAVMYLRDGHKAYLRATNDKRRPPCDTMQVRTPLPPLYIPCRLLPSDTCRYVCVSCLRFTHARM